MANPDRDALMDDFTRRLARIATADVERAIRKRGAPEITAMHPYSAATVCFDTNAGDIIISRPTGDIRADLQQAPQTLLGVWLEELGRMDQARLRQAIDSISVLGSDTPGVPAQLDSGTPGKPTLYYEAGSGWEGLLLEIERKHEWAIIHMRNDQAYEVWAEGEHYDTAPTRDMAERMMLQARLDYAQGRLATRHVASPSTMQSTSSSTASSSTSGSNRSGASGCMVTLIVLVLGVIGVIVIANALRGGTISTAGSQSNGGGSTSTIIYQSSLTTPDSAWEPDQNCFFASDGFHAKPNLACQSPVRDPGDVDVSVQMRQISGAPTDQNGIEVRRSGDPASFYEFDIDANGGWFFWKCIQTVTNCDVLTSGSNSAIQTGLGATNTVEVRAVGSQFTLLVNGTQVGQLDDTALASGDVWLDTGGSAECVFTNFKATRP